MTDRLAQIISAYHASTDASQRLRRLEAGMAVIQDGGLEEFEEDRLLEVLVGRVMARRQATV